MLRSYKNTLILYRKHEANANYLPVWIGMFTTTPLFLEKSLPFWIGMFTIIPPFLQKSFWYVVTISCFFKGWPLKEGFSSNVKLEACWLLGDETCRFVGDWSKSGETRPLAKISKLETSNSRWTRHPLGRSILQVHRFRGISNLICSIW